MDGKPLATFGSYGRVSGPNTFVDKFNNPLGISVIEDFITVVDFDNNRVLAYDHDFNFRWVAGNKKGDPYQ